MVRSIGKTSWQMYSPIGRGGRSGEFGFPSRRTGSVSQIVPFGETVEFGSGYGTLEAHCKRRADMRKIVCASMVSG